MKTIGWILAAFAAVLGLLFVAFKMRSPTTGATTATATGSAAGVGSSTVPSNGTAQQIVAVGGAVTSVLGALGNLFGDDDDGATV